MSSNSGIIINRSNSASPFFSAIKQRNSSAGGAGLNMLYSSEVNTAPQAKSRLRLISSSNPGYSRTIRIPLGRFALLNKLFLHTTWSASTLEDAAKPVKHIPGIGYFSWSECRLVSQGATIAKVTPWQCLADIMLNSSDEDLRKHQILVGLQDQNNPNGNASTVCPPDKDGRLNGSHHASGGTNGNDGVSHYYAELPFWFSRRNNLALDLGILANEVQLEVDIVSADKIWVRTGSVSTIPELNEIACLCYVTELSDETEKNFRSLTYQSGQPVTQLCYSNSHSLVGSALPHASATTNTKFALKLNQFSGLVKHLYIFGVISDDFQTNGHRFRPIALDNLKISANGSEIYHLEKLNDKEDIVESLVNQTRYRGGSNVGVVTHASNKFKTTGIAGDVSVTEAGVTGAQLVACANAYGEMIENSLVGGIKDFAFVPQNVYKVTFQNPFDFSKVSCSGVADFGQMSLPTLEGEICSGGVAGYFNNVYTGGGSNKVDIHVCATNQALMSYITNSSGSTTIRSIEN